jgi:protein N-lysine methyltransferase METTL21D
MRPAHRTKHLPRVQYALNRAVFDIDQRDDSGHTTGSTVWLGAQCLALYLADSLAHAGPRGSDPARRPRAIELGSGLGLTACVPIPPGHPASRTSAPPQHACPFLLTTAASADS